MKLNIEERRRLNVLKIHLTVSEKSYQYLRDHVGWNNADKFIDKLILGSKEQNEPRRT